MLSFATKTGGHEFSLLLFSRGPLSDTRREQSTPHQASEHEHARMLKKQNRKQQQLLLELCPKKGSSTACQRSTHTQVVCHRLPDIHAVVEFTHSACARVGYHQDSKAQTDLGIVQ